MALFWSKKPKAEKNYESEKKSAVVSRQSSEKAQGARRKTPAAPVLPERTTAPVRHAAPSGRFDAATAVIVRPHVTEKSGLLSQGGVYTFVVSSDANKPAVMKAVKHLYKVTPTRVNISKLPAKSVWAKGKWGRVSGLRKAIVTVKKGDKIDFV